MSLQDEILYVLQKRGRGNFVTAEQFVDFGKDAAIRKAFSRLKADGEIIDIVPGLYYYPKIDEQIGQLLPSPDEVAYAVAKKDGVIITPTEEKAMNVTGMSTQVPINVVFLSNGRTKRFKYGRIRITFKNVSSKRAVAGKTNLGVIVRTMEGIGEQYFNDKQREKILKKLEQASDRELKEAAQKSPSWIADFFSEIITSRNEKISGADS